MSSTNNDGGEPVSLELSAGRAIPLTLQQQAWWTLFQHNDLNRFDTVFAVHLTGPINSAVLSASLRELIRRHESLHTIILSDEKRPIQQLALPGNHHEIEIIPIRGRLEDELASARKICSNFASRTIDLATGPLFDAKILEFSEVEHLLIWGANHLIVDGHSFHLLFRELWMLYRELIRGRLPALIPLPMRIADYQIWQSHKYQTWLQMHSGYWKERLSGATGVQWPITKSQGLDHIAIISHKTIEFPLCVSQGLRALAKTMRTTVSIVVLSVYVSVVARWCRQQDLVIQTIFHGRDRLEHRSIVGFLAHFVYMRLEHVGEQTIVEFVQQVHQEFFRTLFHKDFGSIVSNAPELLAGTYFQWLSWAFDGVSGIPTATESIELGINGELFPFEQPATLDFRLLTVLWDTSEGIRGRVSYPSSDFSDETIERLVECLKETGTIFVADPSMRLSQS